MTVSQQKYGAFERSLCRISCYHFLLVNIERSLCCLHRAKALVPYDEHGRRCSGEKMWLNLQVIIAILEGKTTLHFKVGERVKLASGHDHNAIPSYTTTVPLTEK